jgi:hypothetical protein
MAAVSDQTALGGLFCYFRFRGALGGFASSLLAFFVFWLSDYCKTTKIQTDPSESPKIQMSGKATYQESSTVVRQVALSA